MELSPTYMLYGMSYEQYWYGKPSMAIDFRELYKLRVNERNEELWRQGLYFLDALNTSLHNNLNFSGHTVQPKQYMEKPIQIFADDTNKAKESADKVVDNLEKWRKAMGAFYGNRNNKP